MMYIGNDLIESVTLNDESIPRPGYVGQFKRTLKLKHKELLHQYPDPPEFLVSNPTQQASNNSPVSSIR